METVLVVDDDQAVRRLASRILSEAGYRVIEAGHPEAALAEAAATRVDLVLTDVFMPGMSGAELASHLRADAPGLPVLLMTGAPDGIRPVNGSGNPVEVLAKPFLAAELLARVGRLLDE